MNVGTLSISGLWEACLKKTYKFGLTPHFPN